jgi:sugar phosphate isomerase/epimerase
MRILYFCPHWGNTLPFDAFCRRVKKAGYDGVETDLPLATRKKKELLQMLRDNGLLLIGQYWQSVESNYTRNREQYKRHLDNLIDASPVMVNAQTGKDYFSFRQNMRLIADAKKRSKASGIPVCHETHRGKFLFSLPVFSAAIKEDPEIQITLDASHWCTVHESLLDDQRPDLQKALRAAAHIHARIGFEQGPQINDPSAPEWSGLRERYLSWWKVVAGLHEKQGRDLTVTAEFGPRPYMPLAPRTQKPLTDQWKANLYMVELLRSKFA